MRRYAPLAALIQPPLTVASSPDAVLSNPPRTLWMSAEQNPEGAVPVPATLSHPPTTDEESQPPSCPGRPSPNAPTA